MAETVICYSGELVSRKDAKAASLTRYFTGKPCPHGHIAQRMTSGTACVECSRQRRLKNPDANYAAVKAWRAANPEKWAAQSKRYAVRHPDKVRANVDRYNVKHREKVLAANAEYQRKRRRNDPVGNRERVERFKARREDALAEIAGRPRPKTCDVCNEFYLRIVFDHCHVGGHFRGWICDRCNRVLGLVEDSAAVLEGLAKYLRKSNGASDGSEAERSFGQDLRVSGHEKISDTG
jgi:hypothetical protein